MRRLTTFFFLSYFIFFTTTLFSQSFSTEEKLQGYANRGDQLVLLFDASLYQVNPQKVVVTGQFRNWSAEMEDEKWILQKKKDQLWTLNLENPAFENFPPLTQFKYRIDDGQWLAPPAGAPNEKAGNLEFMSGFVMPSITAELRGPQVIWAKIEGMERPLQKSAYRIVDAKGNEIAVAAVLPNTADETLIKPVSPLDIKRVYFLEIPDQNLRTFCDFDGWFRTLYSEKELGANISEDGESTAFRVFAPRAELVKLYLYQNPNDEKSYETFEMEIDEDGVWEMLVNKNLKGIYYDFTIHGADDPGNHFYNKKEQHLSDPYARVSMDSWGKSRVWSATKPATPLKNGIPKLEEVIAYEVHVQDFTDQLPVGKKLKGTIPAMHKSGLQNTKGEKIGFDYLLDLGINTVHLMPVQEFLHFPDEEWKASFQNDPYMKEHGIHEENYQWGYRTTHCFAVESRFREKGTEPGAERDQFRDLVQAFHDKGIAVIIDIVPNHTGENMDGMHVNFHFNGFDQQYYYRTKNFEHIGAFGNEVKTENRPMVQRWLIDQCQHFIQEFGIDGFRIDLAGQVDEQTLIMLREAIGPDIIVYGEPWIGSNDPRFEANPDWDWYKADAPITFFQDDTRNAFKGTVANPVSKEKDRGWAGGNIAERSNVQKGLSASFTEDKTPLSGINYLDIHDNWALADQFATQNFDGRFGVDEDRFKIAATLLYTSLGPIVLHGGTEIMRSKGAAPLKEVIKKTKSGASIYLHGMRDTYNQRLANNFVWENVGKSKADENSHCDYKNMYEFWRGLNRFRLSEMGKIFQLAEQAKEGYYQWILPANESALGYIVDEKVMVLLNSSTTPFVFNVSDLPKGNWKLIANNKNVNHENGVDDEPQLMKIVGGAPHQIKLDGVSLKIWVKE